MEEKTERAHKQAGNTSGNARDLKGKRTQDVHQRATYANGRGARIRALGGRGGTRGYSHTARVLSDARASANTDDGEANLRYRLAHIR
ncbi:hypothetical protein LCGC14_2928080, partial [marine sediment metagenome]